MLAQACPFQTNIVFLKGRIHFTLQNLRYLPWTVSTEMAEFKTGAILNSEGKVLQQAMDDHGFPRVSSGSPWFPATIMMTLAVHSE